MANRSLLNQRKTVERKSISAIAASRDFRPIYALQTKKVPVTNKETGAKAKVKKIKPRKPKDYSLPEGIWDCLPDIVLEDIFSRLSIRDRHVASQVCRNWNRIFYSNHVWSTFTLEDKTLTRRKYNYHLGYQHVMDHYRAQVCMNKVGRAIRHLVIKPMDNFFNLYEFLTISTYFTEIIEDKPLSNLRTLDFTFACDYATTNNRENEDKVFGTGGKLLEALKRLMSNLSGLRHLSLQDLLLDKAEAMYLLDDVAYNCCETLRTLRIINCTKDPYPFFHAGVFVNLSKLTISPQHLNEDIVILIGYTNLKDLWILQTKHTDTASPVAAKAWRECRKASPFLNVHLKIEGLLRTELIWQEGAPVRSIVYHCRYSTISFGSILACTSLFSPDIREYAHLGLPRFHMSRKFQERPDSSLILMARACPNLHTLVIRELISTATVLLLAQECRNLKRLVVRKNALLKKFDWPHNPAWTTEYYCWLRTTSLSHELTIKEMSRLLGFRWTPLTDREFKLFTL